MNFLLNHAAEGQIVTGLCMSTATRTTCTAISPPSAAPLNALGEKELCPGSATLDKFNASLR